MKSVVKTNLSQLELLHEIIHTLEPEEYANSIQGAENLFNFTIGQQTRHILDHYTVLQESAATGKIDYYLRKRPLKLETEKEAAIETIEAIINFLPDLDNDHPVQVQSEGRQDRLNEFSQSSLQRELSFLATHTIHHLAILKIMVNFIGKACHPETGMAPSTIEFIRS